jgi:hypothetical protein
MLRLIVERDRRLGQWRVEAPQLGLTDDPRDAGGAVPLNYALMRINQAEAGHRYPLLAVGANASPAHLAHKLERLTISATIPMVRVLVRGLAVGVSAHIADSGYVSASPIADPNATSDLFVLFLDAAQLEAIDATEDHYRRVLLPGERFQVTMPSGELLGGCYTYVNRHGVLVDHAGAPRCLGDQRELLRGLLKQSPQLRRLFGEDPESFVKQARADENLRRAGARVFHEEGWVTDQAGFEPYLIGDPSLVSYDDLHPRNDLPPGTLRAGRTPDRFDQRGVAVIRVRLEVADHLGDPRHVIVQNAQVPGTNRHRLGVLAKVIVTDAVPQTEQPTIQLDLSIRVAIGLQAGEAVTLTPAHTGQKRWSDLFFGRPNYVICRVQPADRATAEHEICLLDELTLEMLGVASGDEVVVEGFPNSDGVVPSLRVKTFKTSTSIQELREELHGGNLASRYPSSRDALGSFPDLPWTFIDASLREALGLQDQRLGTVRVHCSRSYQLKKELREMMLLLGIAFIGVVTVLKETIWQLLSLAVLVSAVGIVSTIRMRGRLSQQARLFAPSGQQRRRRRNQRG